MGDGVWVLERQQGAGVAGGNAALRQQLPGKLRQADEPERVADMAAGLADDLRDLGVRIAWAAVVDACPCGDADGRLQGGPQMA